jgi:trehalose-6-phosphatase
MSASAAEGDVPLVTADLLRAATSDSELCFFLDYDGTLAPIVNEPDKAFISDECVRRA